MMLEQYETLFGIYDHTREDPLHPFAAVELHPAEDNLTYSLLFERLEQFIFHKVFNASGVSWQEFKELPSYEAAELMRLCSIRRAKEEQSASEEAKKLLNGIK